MDTLDRLRRASTFRGRTTVAQQVSTRHKQFNPLLSELLESGQATPGEELTEADGAAVFVFGATPMTDAYTVR